MSEEDLKLLQAVRDWRPPEKLHPIAMHCWYLYEDNGFSLPREAIQNLRDVLNDYGEDLIALAEALEGMSRFVLLMTTNRDDQKTADQVADLMREYTHLFEPFWERVGEALNNVSAEVRGSFQHFMGSDPSNEKAAPAYGARAPDDSVPLKNLIPQGRPPPWIAKKEGGKK